LAPASLRPSASLLCKGVRRPYDWLRYCGYFSLSLNPPHPPELARGRHRRFSSLKPSSSSSGGAGCWDWRISPGLPASSAVMGALGGICGATQPMLAPFGTLPTRSAVRLNAVAQLIAAPLRQYQCVRSSANVAAFPRGVTTARITAPAAPAATSDRQCAVSCLPPSQRQREPKRPSILGGWPGAPTAVALGLPLEDVCCRQRLRSRPSSREPGRDSRAKSRPPGPRGEGFQGSLVGLAPTTLCLQPRPFAARETPSSSRRHDSPRPGAVAGCRASPLRVF
jgi:hypothetical protein